MKSATLLLAIVSACSINHPSDNIQCIIDSDCDGNGKTCFNNQCVSNTPPGDDAPPPPDDTKPPPPDAFFCPSQCTSCDASTMGCTIDCSANANNCNGKITCPAGFNCEILCNVDNACRSGVDCTLGLDCTVACDGSSTCRNLICGIGRCNIACNGLDSCRNVSCGAACACDTTCGPLARCELFTCKRSQGPFGCRNQLGDCTSQLDGCNTCP